MGEANTCTITGMDLADLPGGAGAPIDSIDDLVAAVAMLDRSRARVALGVAKVAASGLWAIDGSVSIKSWLQQHCRLSSLDAHRLVDDGRFLAAHDSVASAAITGRISGSQVGVLRSVVTRSTAQLFDEHQGVIVEQIEGMDVADTIKVAQRWKVCAEAVADMPEPKVPDRAWSSSRLADGTTVGRFVFDAVASEQIETAIETARSYDGDSDTRTHAMRAADAVASVFAFFNANHESEGTPRHRPHVELHFEADAHGDPAGDAITTSGRMLPDWARDMFACDCVIHRVLRSGSAVLDYGRSTRRVARGCP